jgi:hypothetical protein
MSTLVCLLEEPSAREMLQGVLPRILPSGWHVRYIVFQGKQDLEKNLVIKLRGWLAPDSLFVVLRDQDAGDCHKVKQGLVALCRQAGREHTLVRVACRELESFYLGDLAAVEKGLGYSGLARMQRKKQFRAPDSLANPALELERLTAGLYQKVAGSRAIAPHLELEGNTSHSFNALLQGLRRIVATRL